MAEDNNKIVIEVVLDDGSVARGFAKITDQAKKAAEDSKKEFKTVGDILNTDLVEEFTKSLKSIPLSFVGIATAVGAIGFALKEAFDLTLAGEKTKAIEKQFEVIAEGAGLIGHELQSALEQSARGLIDTTDLLKIANGAMIELGANAARLPEVLELSRKVALGLGKPIEEVFQGLVSGIESGNIRALKQQGIILDSEAAFTKYAVSIGITAGELSKAQQQQAVLNAVLEQGSKKFKDIDDSATPLQDNITRINVALKNSKEAFEALVNSKLGDFFVKITSGVAEALQDINRLNSQSPGQKAVTDLADLKAELIGLEANLPSLIKKYEDLGFFGNLAFGKELANQITNSRARIDELNATLAQSAVITSVVASEVKKSADIQVAAANIIAPLTQKQINAETERAAQIQQLRLQAQSDFIAAQEGQLASITEYGAKVVAIEEITRQQQLLNEENYQRALKEIDTKYSDEKGFSEQQRLSARLSLQDSFASKSAQIEAKRVQAEKAAGTERLQNYSSIAGQIATLQSSSSNELAAIGKAAAITQATIDGYLAVQKVFAVVPVPFAFPVAALVAAAAAANIAKIASTGGGGGGGSFDTSVASGGAGGVPEAPPSFAPKSELERAPTASTVININGDILGDETSGRKIVELINSAYDSSGISLREGVV